MNEWSESLIFNRHSVPLQQSDHKEVASNHSQIQTQLAQLAHQSHSTINRQHQHIKH